MGFGNINSLKIKHRKVNGKQKWFVEYLGEEVSDEYKTREEAVNSVKPLVEAVKRNRALGKDVKVQEELQ